MRIHTKLEEQDIYQAAGEVPVGVLRVALHRSRSHDRAFDVILHGSGRLGGQWGSHDYRSAMWDEWGLFLGNLYRKDPGIKAGEAYVSAEHFHWATGARFTAKAVKLHQHKWKYQGDNVTGRYYVGKCPGCQAIKRWARSTEDLAVIMDLSRD